MGSRLHISYLFRRFRDRIARVLTERMVLRTAMTLVVYGDGTQEFIQASVTVLRGIEPPAETIVLVPIHSRAEVESQLGGLRFPGMRVVGMSAHEAPFVVAAKQSKTQWVLVFPLDSGSDPRYVATLGKTKCWRGVDLVFVPTEPLKKYAGLSEEQSALIVDSAGGNKVWRRSFLEQRLRGGADGSCGLELSLKALGAGVRARMCEQQDPMQAVPGRGGLSLENVERTLVADSELLTSSNEAVWYAEAILASRLSSYLAFVPYFDRAYSSALGSFARLILSMISPEQFGGLPLVQRSALAVASTGDQVSMEEFVGALSEHTSAVVIAPQKDGQSTLWAPWIPADIEEFPYKVEVLRDSDISISCSVRHITWVTHNEIRLRGHAYVRGLREPWQSGGSWYIDTLTSDRRVARSTPILSWTRDDSIDFFANDPWTTYATRAFEACVAIESEPCTFQIRYVPVSWRSAPATTLLPFPSHQSNVYNGSGWGMVPGPGGALSVREALPPREGVAIQPRPTLRKVAVDGESLNVEGSTAAQHPGFQIGLTNSSGAISVEVTVVGKHHWRALFDLSDIRLAEAGYFLRWRDLNDRNWKNFDLDKDLLDEPIQFLEGPVKSARMEILWGVAAGVTIGSPIPFSAQSRWGRQQLQDTPVPSLQTSIYFQSFNGMSCGDNPRALYDALRAGDPDVTVFWGVKDAAVETPPGSLGVIIGSPEWFDAIQTSRVLVTNSHLPLYFSKRRGQLWIQTWHGMPLKGMANAAPRATTAPMYRRAITRQAAQWNLLLAQDEEAELLLRESFDYGGEICIGEQPRNIRLLSPDARDRVRTELGISTQTLVLLYAPTWRPSAAIADVEPIATYAAELAELSGALVLLRLHHMSGRSAEERPGVIDVSDYPFVEDLMAASDALISDWSSAIMDYRLLGRPVVSFTPDEEYFLEVRKQFRRVPEAVARSVHTVEEAWSELGRQFKDLRPGVTDQPDRAPEDTIQYLLGRMRAHLDRRGEP